MVFDFIFFFIDLLSGECKKKAKKKNTKKQKQLEKGKVSKRMPDNQKRREGKAYTKT